MWIVRFDGVCNLCQASVQFIIRHDRQGRFKFAPLLTGETGTVVVEIDGKVYTKSTAALQIARRLDGVWKAAYIFIIIPRPIRDAMYTYIANRRYRWFGRQEQCMVPTADIRVRFLEGHDD
jgi:predicted DCC family thiol-disulfide oxidoreductase YuxK